MVKIEDYEDSDDSSDVEVLEKPVLDAGPSGLKSCSISVLKEEEKDLSSSSCGHLRSYFVGMGFSPTLVDKVIEENVEDDANLLLEALFTYSKSNPVAADSLDGFSSSDKEKDDSSIHFNMDDNEETEDLDGPSTTDMDKKTSLLMMDFSEEEIDLAINRLGEDAVLTELVDFIVAAQTAGCYREEGVDKSVSGDDGKNEESAVETLFGTMDKTLFLLQMGFTEDEVSSAIDNFGPEVPVTELADSIFANRISYRVEKEEDLLYDVQATEPARCLDRVKVEFSEPYFPLSEESNALNAIHEYEGIKKAKKIKHVALDEEKASSSNHRKQARLAEWETACLTKPSAFDVLGDLADARFVKEETPEQSTPNLFGNVRHFLCKPPYFFYGNVVDVSQETWRKLSQFLYGMDPEYVNSQFFSAFIRKEGYFHNLPTENRFYILPKPPMTVEDALPHTKRWWPSWDTRKQLSSISSETTGVGRLCERLGKMMVESQGILSKEQQIDVLHQCKTLNLIWVGENKLSPIEPDQVECILGYPMQHTNISGLEPSDRLRALKYCFQTDTLGYHLSVLKQMYPDGLRVLSVYSGIGGAEVALHRLGIHLKCVVSVEASETNRKILKRWWYNSGQSGELKQIGGIEMLTIQKLESFIKELGGFDVIIGGNPSNYLTGASNRDCSVGMDLNQFFEFVRVLQRVRSLQGRNC